MSEALQSHLRRNSAEWEFIQVARALERFDRAGRGRRRAGAAQPLHSRKHLYVPTLVVEHVTHVYRRPMVGTLMLKLFGPKVYLSKSMKSANYSHALHGLLPWADGELLLWKMLIA
jgi:hypothetical protein